MIFNNNITRRTFLNSLVSLASLCISQLGWSAGELIAANHSGALAFKLARFYPDRKSARVIGLEYLRAVPSEENVSLLVDLICLSNTRQGIALTQADKETLGELLRFQQCQDFEQGRVINIRGWMLSETECRLCALAALI